MLSKFNGTSTPKGSYRAKTGDNDYKVNSSRYSLSTALCESIRYQAKSEQNVRQDLRTPRKSLPRFVGYKNEELKTLHPRKYRGYSGPCDLRPPIQPEKYGLKLKVVLKYRDIYTENIQVVSLISGLKMKGIVK